MTRLALMKIWSHAHEGAPLEIIGIMLGYIADEAVRYAQSVAPRPVKCVCGF
jgi:proteasome lid subunit RPN8/RPN11